MRSDLEGPLEAGHWGAGLVEELKVTLIEDQEILTIPSPSSDEAGKRRKGGVLPISDDNGGREVGLEELHRPDWDHGGGADLHADTPEPKRAEI